MANNMANKPASRNWNDIQLTIAAASLALTLVFWNLFAGPDRVAALKRVQEQAALDQAERERIAQEQALQAQAASLQQPLPAAPQVAAQPAPTQLSGPIFFGGSAPQTVIIQNGGRGGGGGGGGASGGGTGGS